MRKLSESSPLELVLLARIVDELRVLQWLLCGAKEHNKPESVTAKLFAASEPKTPRTGYDSGADFDKAWKELTGNV